MKPSVYISTMRKLKAKLMKGYRTRSPKHIRKAGRDIALFASTHQATSLAIWLEQNS